ncbi:hypothetical protein B0T24DRAFT_135348 [Lasiosphaeria ovina]|uniref:Uncharacterized protein n=1 Tax=Lasiosphaeria ovina TaxID=92902 RepID=A0AAE0JRD1_9PEZI|nr:hypothetical protein B0T24DRAFT_135348 [Lasiosphaeria ovina]
MCLLPLSSLHLLPGRRSLSHRRHSLAGGSFWGVIIVHTSAILILHRLFNQARTRKQPGSWAGNLQAFSVSPDPPHLLLGGGNQGCGTKSPTGQDITWRAGRQGQGPTIAFDGPKSRVAGPARNLPASTLTRETRMENKLCLLPLRPPPSAEPEDNHILYIHNQPDEDPWRQLVRVANEEAERRVFSVE